MKYMYDCEFLEDGRTIELISLGMVCEDGREFYGVNREFRWSRIAHRVRWSPWRWKVEHPWLLEHVVPSLPKLHGDARLHYSTNAPGALGILDYGNLMSRRFLPLREIAECVLALVGDDPDVELWADYGAYDHVALCQLWGPMIGLPPGMPMWTNDLRQEWVRQGRPELPAQAAGVHNALEDARHNVVIAKALGLLGKAGE